VNGFTRSLAIGLMAVAAAGYGVTSTWCGKAEDHNHATPRALPVECSLAEASPVIRRLPPLAAPYPSTDVPSVPLAGRDSALKPATYLAPLAIAALGQTPAVPQIEDFKGEGALDLNPRADGT